MSRTLPRRKPALRPQPPPKTDFVKLKSLSTLQIALGASVIVHAALLTVRIVDPEGFNRVFQDTPLEVVLVNARSDQRPAIAQAIAQANLAGGGEAAAGRATSPLPPAATVEVGGRTVAIVAGGHAEPGPRAHRRLLASIIGSGGAVISGGSGGNGSASTAGANSVAGTSSGTGGSGTAGSAARPVPFASFRYSVS